MLTMIIQPEKLGVSFVIDATTVLGISKTALKISLGQSSTFKGDN